MSKLRTLIVTQRILPPVPKEDTRHTSVCAGSHSAPTTFRVQHILFLTLLLPLTSTMPAIRKTKKSTKSSTPYAKKEKGVKAKDEQEDKPKIDVGNGTYDRVQMFSDIIRVSLRLRCN